MIDRLRKGLLAVLAMVTLLACNGSPPAHLATQVAPPAPPAALQTIAQPSPGHLVVLMITDNSDHIYGGTDASIGPGVTNNASKMSAFFNQVAAATGQQLVSLSIVGTAVPPDPFTCPNINEKLRSLAFDKDDTVVVYYAGHGFNLNPQTVPNVAQYAVKEFANTKPTEMPFLYCGDPNLKNSVNLDMIASWIARKQPRLTIIIADACNSFLTPTPAPPSGVAAAAPPLPPTGPDLRYISLFLEARGNVMIAGNAAGEKDYSFYQTPNSSRYPMGLATKQLLDIFASMPRDERTTWQSVGARFTSMSVLAKDPEEPATAPAKQFQQKPILWAGAPFLEPSVAQ